MKKNIGSHLLCHPRWVNYCWCCWKTLSYENDQHFVVNINFFLACNSVPLPDLPFLLVTTSGHFVQRDTSWKACAELVKDTNKDFSISKKEIAVSPKICPIYTLSARPRTWINPSKERAGMSVILDITWWVSTKENAICWIASTNLSVAVWTVQATSARTERPAEIQMGVTLATAN